VSFCIEFYLFTKVKNKIEYVDIVIFTIIGGGKGLDRATYS